MEPVPFPAAPLPNDARNGAADGDSTPDGLAEADAGQVLAVVSGHGSPGRSTVALALATALGVAAPTVLVDADDAGPSIAAMLDADPTRNLSMLAHADPATPSQWDRAIAREAQPIRASSPHGVVLCGLPKPEMRGALAPAFVDRLIVALAQRHRYVVLDLSAGLVGPDAEVQQVALHRADRVLLVATGDIVGLLHARRALAALQSSCAIPRERIALVLNRWDARYSHSRQEIEWALEAPVAAIVPHDHRAAQAALAAQRPLVVQPRSRAARALLELAERLHAGTIGLPAEREPSRVRAWGRRTAACVRAPIDGLVAAGRGLWDAGASRAPTMPAAHPAPVVALVGEAPQLASSSAAEGDTHDRAA